MVRIAIGWFRIDYEMIRVRLGLVLEQRPAGCLALGVLFHLQWCA